MGNCIDLFHHKKKSNDTARQVWTKHTGIRKIVSLSCVDLDYLRIQKVVIQLKQKVKVKLIPRSVGASFKKELINTAIDTKKVLQGVLGRIPTGETVSIKEIHDGSDTFLPIFNLTSQHTGFLAYISRGMHW